MLPLCLLWALIACVALCLYHGEESHTTVAVEVLDSHCGPDGCPITDDTQFARPPRQPEMTPAGEGQHACPSSAPSLDGVYASSTPEKSEETSTPSSVPPAERICILRI